MSSSELARRDWLGLDSQFTIPPQPTSNARRVEALSFLHHAPAIFILAFSAFLHCKAHHFFGTRNNGKEL